MTNATQSARLLCMGGALATGTRRPITRPAQIKIGTIDELVSYVAEQDSEELWRYTIVTETDEQHIRGADLRRLVEDAR